MLRSAHKEQLNNSSIPERTPSRKMANFDRNISGKEIMKLSKSPLNANKATVTPRRSCPISIRKPTPKSLPRIVGTTLKIPINDQKRLSDGAIIPVPSNKRFEKVLNQDPTRLTSKSENAEHSSESNVDKKLLKDTIKDQDSMLNAKEVKPMCSVVPNIVLDAPSPRTTRTAVEESEDSEQMICITKPKSPPALPSVMTIDINVTITPRRRGSFRRCRSPRLGSLMRRTPSNRRFSTLNCYPDHVISISVSPNLNGKTCSKPMARNCKPNKLSAKYSHEEEDDEEWTEDLESKETLNEQSISDNTIEYEYVNKQSGANNPVQTVEQHNAKNPAAEDLIGKSDASQKREIILNATLPASKLLDESLEEPKTPRNNTESKTVSDLVAGPKAHAEILPDKPNVKGVPAILISSDSTEVQDASGCSFILCYPTDSKIQSHEQIPELLVKPEELKPEGLLKEIGFEKSTLEKVENKVEINDENNVKKSYGNENSSGGNGKSSFGNAASDSSTNFDTRQVLGDNASEGNLIDDSKIEKLQVQMPIITEERTTTKTASEDGNDLNNNETLNINEPESTTNGLATQSSPITLNQPNSFDDLPMAVVSANTLMSNISKETLTSDISAETKTPITSEPTDKVMKTKETSESNPFVEKATTPVSEISSSFWSVCYKPFEFLSYAGGAVYSSIEGITGSSDVPEAEESSKSDSELKVEKACEDARIMPGITDDIVIMPGSKLSDIKNDQKVQENHRNCKCSLCWSDGFTIRMASKKAPSNISVIKLLFEGRWPMMSYDTKNNIGNLQGPSNLVLKIDTGNSTSVGSPQNENGEGVNETKETQKITPKGHPVIKIVQHLEDSKLPMNVENEVPSRGIVAEDVSESSKERHLEPTLLDSTNNPLKLPVIKLDSFSQPDNEPSEVGIKINETEDTYSISNHSSENVVQEICVAEENNARNPERMVDTDNESFDLLNHLKGGVISQDCIYVNCSKPLKVLNELNSEIANVTTDRSNYIENEATSLDATLNQPSAPPKVNEITSLCRLSKTPTNGCRKLPSFGKVLNYSSEQLKDPKTKIANMPIQLKETLFMGGSGVSSDCKSSKQVEILKNSPEVIKLEEIKLDHQEKFLQMPKLSSRSAKVKATIMQAQMKNYELLCSLYDEIYINEMFDKIKNTEIVCSLQKVNTYPLERLSNSLKSLIVAPAFAKEVAFTLENHCFINSHVPSINLIDWKNNTRWFAKVNFCLPMLGNLRTNHTFFVDSLREFSALKTRLPDIEPSNQNMAFDQDCLTSVFYINLDALKANYESLNTNSRFIKHTEHPMTTSGRSKCNQLALLLNQNSSSTSYTKSLFYRQFTKNFQQVVDQWFDMTTEVALLLKISEVLQRYGELYVIENSGKLMELASPLDFTRKFSKSIGLYRKQLFSPKDVSKGLAVLLKIQKVQIDQVVVNLIITESDFRLDEFNKSVTVVKSDEASVISNEMQDWNEHLLDNPQKIDVFTFPASEGKNKIMIPSKSNHIGENHFIETIWKANILGFHSRGSTRIPSILTIVPKPTKIDFIVSDKRLRFERRLLGSFTVGKYIIGASEQFNNNISSMRVLYPYTFLSGIKGTSFGYANDPELKEFVMKIPVNLTRTDRDKGYILEAHKQGVDAAIVSITNQLPSRVMKVNKQSVTFHKSSRNNAVTNVLNKVFTTVGIMENPLLILESAVCDPEMKKATTIGLPFSIPTAESSEMKNNDLTGLSLVVSNVKAKIKKNETTEQILTRVVIPSNNQASTETSNSEEKLPKTEVLKPNNQTFTECSNSKEKTSSFKAVEPKQHFKKRQLKNKDTIPKPVSNARNFKVSKETTMVPRKKVSKVYRDSSKSHASRTEPFNHVGCMSNKNRNRSRAKQSVQSFDFRKKFAVEPIRKQFSSSSILDCSMLPRQTAANINPSIDTKLNKKQNKKKLVFSKVKPNDILPEKHHNTKKATETNKSKGCSSIFGKISSTFTPVFNSIMGFFGSGSEKGNSEKSNNLNEPTQISTGRTKLTTPYSKGKNKDYMKFTGQLNPTKTADTPNTHCFHKNAGNTKMTSAKKDTSTGRTTKHPEVQTDGMAGENDTACMHVVTSKQAASTQLLTLPGPSKEIVDQLGRTCQEKTAGNSTERIMRKTSVIRNCENNSNKEPERSVQSLGTQNSEEIVNLPENSNQKSKNNKIKNTKLQVSSDKIRCIFADSSDRKQNPTAKMSFRRSNKKRKPNLILDAIPEETLSSSNSFATIPVRPFNSFQNEIATKHVEQLISPQQRTSSQLTDLKNEVSNSNTSRSFTSEISPSGSSGSDTSNSGTSNSVTSTSEIASQETSHSETSTLKSSSSGTTTSETSSTGNSTSLSRNQPSYKTVQPFKKRSIKRYRAPDPPCSSLARQAGPANTKHNPGGITIWNVSAISIVPTVTKSNEISFDIVQTNFWNYVGPNDMLPKHNGLHRLRNYLMNWIHQTKSVLMNTYNNCRRTIGKSNIYSNCRRAFGESNIYNNCRNAFGDSNIYKNCRRTLVESNIYQNCRRIFEQSNIYNNCRRAFGESH